MAYKRLDEGQLKELEILALNGTAPGDISDYFGIAVSSVHNYKRVLAEKGLQLPDVRGKRPSGIYREAEAGVSMLTPNELQDRELTFFTRMLVRGVEVYISNSLLEESKAALWIDENMEVTQR
jgi:transposase